MHEKVGASMFLMIDNYDSFVYNLVRYFEELQEEVCVYRNDKITIEVIRNMKPEGIIISPGPKTPKEAGLSLDIIGEFKGKVPILGICLGHQAIVHYFGGDIICAAEPMHGKISEIHHEEQGIFRGLKSPFMATRYHSLIVDTNTLPDILTTTACTKDGTIMAVKHKEYFIEGVQFHPEAELSECGHEILKNFIDKARLYNNSRD